METFIDEYIIENGVRDDVDRFVARARDILGSGLSKEAIERMKDMMLLKRVRELYEFDNEPVRAPAEERDIHTAAEANAVGHQSELDHKRPSGDGEDGGPSAKRTRIDDDEDDALGILEEALDQSGNAVMRVESEFSYDI